MAFNKDILTGYALEAEWSLVQSSNVYAVGVNRSFPYVFVEYGAGKPVKSLYAYYVVDDATKVYDAIVAAGSKGKAVNQLLKNNWDYVRLL
jgi:hypothetical protein